ncbi:hypothetical protein [Bartonella grahamii]|uniref:hypothetical protein n=1 Tax=Bartonella grahamii TaxID=33045 RepID=UPI002E7B3D6D|nr:hypothetical protein [Bartonella grahamii]
MKWKFKDVGDLCIVRIFVMLGFWHGVEWCERMWGVMLDEGVVFLRKGGCEALSGGGVEGVGGARLLSCVDGLCVWGGGRLFFPSL